MNASTGRFILGLLVGVLLGAGAMYTLVGGAGRPASGEPGLERGLTREVPSSNSKPAVQELASVASEPERSTAKPVEASVAVNDATVERLAAADIDEPTVERGSGVITGFVLDDAGRGLAGVLVRATPAKDHSYSRRADMLSGAPPKESSAEEAVRKTLEARAKRRAARFDVLTDAQGAFEFSALPAGRWSLAGYKQGYRIDSSSSRSVRVGSEVELVAVQVAELPVDVFDANGQRVEGAAIVCDGGEHKSTWSFEWGADEPVIWLPEGSYDITAYSDDGNGHTDRDENTASQASESQSIEILGGVDHQPIVFNLSARCGVRGEVTSSKGTNPSDTPFVYIMPLPAGEEPDLKVLMGAQTKTWAQRGRFSFFELEEGRHVVGVARSWGSPIVDHCVVEVVPGVVECELRMPGLDRASMLVAHVLGPTGAPLKGASFMLQFQAGNHSSGGMLTSHREPDGVYLLEFDAEEAEAWFDPGSNSSRFTLTVTHSKFGQQIVELERGQPEVTITFVEPASLQVTLAGYAGSEHVGKARVSCQPRGEQARNVFFGENKSRLSSSGVQVFDKLSPGSYVARAHILSDPEDPWGGWVEVASAELEILPGENSLQMSIPPLHSFRVHRADTKQGVTLYLAKLEGQGEWNNRIDAEFDGDGYVQFKDIPAGDYALIMYGSGTKRMEITVPTGDVEFTPMEVNALLVNISDEEGDLVKLGFRQDDLVIGIDGEEFEGEPGSQWGELFSSNSARRTYLVLRGSERLEIEVVGADVGDWGTLGGRLVPTTR